MADRPGEADALDGALRWLRAWLGCRVNTESALQALTEAQAEADRLTARLSEAEQALEAVKVVRNKLIRESDRRLGEATRAEARLFKYEQALRRIEKLALDEADAELAVIAILIAARAALSGSAGNDPLAA